MSNILTPRQKEILILFRDGLAYKQIASYLGISLQTVKIHFDNIKNRLEANHKAHALVKAIKQGEITL